MSIFAIKRFAHKVAHCTINSSYVHNFNFCHVCRRRELWLEEEKLYAQHQLCISCPIYTGRCVANSFLCCWISQAVLVGHQDTVPLLGVAAGVRGRGVRGRRVRVVVAVLVEVPGPLQGHKVISGWWRGQRSHALLATCLAGRNCLWTLYSALASHYYPTQQSIGLSECFSHFTREKEGQIYERHTFALGR
jgi:hypothetical protein